jgi:hypothetical protein
MEIFDLTPIKDYRKSGMRMQTADHLIFQCNGLKNEREILKNSVRKRRQLASE